MVKTSNQAIFMLVCFWLGATLHEQETAVRPVCSVRLPICFFPGREKAKLKKQSGQDFQPSHFDCPALHEQETAQSGQFAQTSNCFFQGREKAKWFRLPTCFFPGLEKAKGSDFQFAFSRPGKKQNCFRFPICFFPTREKAIGSLKSNCSCSVARSPT